ncbi:hypothetical protein [Winogradskya consettensis]|uniref:hypothetical protein n=1 Tax=Winogradskya consettensis TaxID=113560 RepID=UPI001BB3A869|nr:hypothetical protein [Actinoplanes consettensis]
MVDGLHEVDWAALEHAYGSAEDVPAMLTALRSADPAERKTALDSFYGAVHHQGDVYRSTTASLPFLFDFAVDPGTPGRAGIVGLLVSIGREAVARAEPGDGEEFGPLNYAGAAAVVRARAAVFGGFVAEDDPEVRRAAVPALGLFFDDGERAAAMLRARLIAEPGVAERLLVVETMATLALRLPGCAAGAVVWFDGIAGDAGVDATTRLAAVVHRFRVEPGDGLVPVVLGLLRGMAQASELSGFLDASPGRVTASGGGAPPQIVAAFTELVRHHQVHTPATTVLRTLHQALEGRVAERTALLAEQLRSPDPGARLDALRMAEDLMTTWRGDHTTLVLLVAGHLGEADHGIAAEAAATLEKCHAIAEPAREALAAFVAGHGTTAWGASEPELRRAYQEAVRALAHFGDGRAVPILLAALDDDVDGWRAIDVAGSLGQAAAEFVPRLCDHLRRVDLAGQWARMSAQPLLSALSGLGDAAAVPCVADVLAAAVRHEQNDVACAALTTLTAFGLAAAPALATIRSLTGAGDSQVRAAAVVALQSAGGPAETLARELLAGDLWFQLTAAADVLGAIGTPAAAALPRLWELLTHSYDWVRLHCAAALWDIDGSPVVLDVLLTAWEKNPAAAPFVVGCLGRMGDAAGPALPMLRAELARPRRDDFGSIHADEELLRAIREIV